MLIENNPKTDDENLFASEEELWINSKICTMEHRKSIMLLDFMLAGIEWKGYMLCAFYSYMAGKTIMQNSMQLITAVSQS